MADFDPITLEIPCRGLNTVMNYTYKYSVYPIKCALDPLTRRNDGSYRPITITAPEGCILNPTHPAPCNARQLTGHLLAGAIYKALAPVIPEKILAESGSAPGLSAVFAGRDRNGSRVSQILFARGGMGAGAHGDGHDCTPFPTNAGAGSIEAFEGLAPLIVWRKELCPDSGGAGKYRGGMGQEIEIEIVSSEPMRLSMLSDRRHCPAQGFLGGQPGAALTMTLRDGSSPHPKSRSLLAPGERLLMKLSGGGGFGDPAERDPAAVASDVRNGYVSAAAARRDYGSTGE